MFRYEIDVETGVETKIEMTAEEIAAHNELVNYANSEGNK